MPIRIAVCFFGWLLVSGVSMTWAQDTHYWNLQYGTRSTLLGGAVIGSVEDLGAVYYNPGVLALQPDPSFLLSARVYDYINLKVTDVDNDNQASLSSRSFRPSPSLFAGSFTLPPLKNQRFGYSVLTRQKFVLNLGSRNEDIPSTPEEDRSLKSFEFSHNLDELWVGLTWSYTPKKGIGIGISQFVAQREQREQAQRTSQEVTGNGVDYSHVTTLENYKYTHYGVLWKVGMEVLLAPVSLGLTLTTPRIGITGDGKRFLSRSSSGKDIDNDGVPDPPQLDATNQSGLTAQYKSSWALGLGAGYRLNKTTFHFTAEWYSQVKPFTVIDSAPYTIVGTGEVISTSLTHALKGVINYGLGIEHSFNDRLGIYGSFVTDFSSKDPASDTNLAVTDWDYYHAAFGTAVELGKIELILGAAYIFTRQRPIRSVEPLDHLDDKLDSIAISTTGVKVIFGFTFDL